MCVCGSQIKSHRKITIPVMYCSVHDYVRVRWIAVFNTELAQLYKYIQELFFEVSYIYSSAVLRTCYRLTECFEFLNQSRMEIFW